MMNEELRQFTTKVPQF